MYYDLRNHLGTVLSADMITSAPGYAGKVRLHADILQQEGLDRYRGQNACVTTSRIGEPRYRLQGDEVSFEDVPAPRSIRIPAPRWSIREPAARRHQKLVACAERRAVHR